MMKRKICCVITARPSYSRIKTALQAIQKENNLELQLIVTGSAVLDRFGAAINFIEEDGFKINKKVSMLLEGATVENMAKSTALGIIELTTAFRELSPDFVITVADRYETMSTAIAAAYMNIPLVHIQGGEVTGSIDEKVRHSITKLADYHFVSTEKAGNYVHRMGELYDRIFVTGCPSIDIAEQVKQEPKLDFNPIKKYGGVGANLNFEQDYVVVLQHPDTKESEYANRQVKETINAVEELGTQVAWFWPNVDAGSDRTSKTIRSSRENGKLKSVHFFKNMSGIDFLKLLINSKMLIGNSSVGIRECSYLGIPVINIGKRQQYRERGLNVIDIGYDSKEIINAYRKWSNSQKIKRTTLYGDGKAGKRISDLLCTIPKKNEKHLGYEDKE